VAGGRAGTVPAPGGRCGAAGARSVVAAAGAAGAGARFFTTSTWTTLLRPWLKLWRTLPASTVLPSSSRPAGRRLNRFFAAS
jgi:hypothetical protein